jgi:hypothetical protein
MAGIVVELMTSSSLWYFIIVTVIITHAILNIAALLPRLLLPVVAAARWRPPSA